MSLTLFGDLQTVFPVSFLPSKDLHFGQKPEYERVREILILKTGGWGGSRGGYSSISPDCI